LFFVHLHNPKFLTPQLLLATHWTVSMSTKARIYSAFTRQKQKSIPRESPRIAGTIFVNCCAAVIANAHQRFIVQVGEGGAARVASRSSGIVCNMQSPDILDNWALTELAEVERRASEINAHIGVLRQIIDESEQRDYDATSSKIIFDSLLLSLSLYGWALHRLRSTSVGAAARAA
jgi:hypothetical protein